MTVCPPRGTNTALNHVLEKVNKMELSSEQKDNFKKALHEIFMSKPSKMFAADMAHILNVGSLKDLKAGQIDISGNDNSKMLTIQTNLSKGTFSTPGFENPEYSGDFYQRDHHIRIQWNVSSMFNHSSESSLVIRVTASEDERWQLTGQDKELKLYRRSLTFHQAEHFCLGLGGHLASVGSQEENEQILREAERTSVWLGGTDQASEGNWSWLNGKPWDFTNWGKYEPSSQDERDCLSVSAFEGEDSPSWHAVSCASTFESFFCRVEPRTNVGSKTLTIERDQNLEFYQILWDHNSKNRNGKGNRSYGLKIVWSIDDTNEKEESEIAESKVFWESMRPKLEYFGLNLTWHQAEEFCVSKGGHLASVNSQFEHNQLKELLKDEKKVQFVWLGGSDEEEEGAWVWSNGAAWRYPGYVWPWGSGEPDGLRGENCLFLMWSGGSDEHWIDHSCNHVGNTGFVCQVPTQKSNFWEILQIVSKTRDENVLWEIILKIRGSQFASTACLNTSEVAGITEQLKGEINVTSEITGSDLNITEADLIGAIELFSILHFCSPPHLVEAVSLGHFLLQLFSEQSFPTFLAALLRTISDHPDNKLLQTFYDKLDNHYKFSLGPLVMGLSNTEQLRQLVKHKPAYISNYLDVINQCLVGQQNCANESSGISIADVDDILRTNQIKMYQNYFSFFKPDVNPLLTSHPAHLVSKDNSTTSPSALIPFCAFNTRLGISSDPVTLLPGENFPICTSFLPTSLEGQLCYKLVLNRTSYSGKRNGLVLLLDMNEDRSVNSLDLFEEQHAKDADPTTLGGCAKMKL